MRDRYSFDAPANACNLNVVREPSSLPNHPKYIRCSNGTESALTRWDSYESGRGIARGEVLPVIRVCTYQQFVRGSFVCWHRYVSKPLVRPVVNRGILASLIPSLPLCHLQWLNITSISAHIETFNMLFSVKYE